MEYFYSLFERITFVVGCVAAVVVEDAFLPTGENAVLYLKLHLEDLESVVLCRIFVNKDAVKNSTHILLRDCIDAEKILTSRRFGSVHQVPFRHFVFSSPQK